LYNLFRTRALYLKLMGAQLRLRSRSQCSSM
jgi:hypothetical protein